MHGAAVKQVIRTKRDNLQRVQLVLPIEVRCHGCGRVHALPAPLLAALAALVGPLPPLGLLAG